MYAFDTLPNALSGTLPVTFEENRGQAAPEVVFLSRAAGYRIVLTRSGAVIAAMGGTVARIRLVDAVSTVPAGLHRLSARSNYLVGSDPAHWHTGVPNYEEVRYTQAYPGIDVRWHGWDGQIEEDFVVSPRAIRQKESAPPVTGFC